MFLSSTICCALPLLGAATFFYLAKIYNSDLLLLPMIWMIYRFMRHFLRNSAYLTNRGVVVTGCDTGFGKAIALQLAKEGAVVFAGVMDSNNGQNLAKIAADFAGVIEPVVMNVTKQEDIDNCLQIVEKSGVILHGVVCNAGISAFGYCEMLPLSRYEINMDVNYFGAVRVTRAFLPMIRASRGRVVNMGSIGAHAPSAFGSAYLSTKAAMVSFSQCLRQELHKFGVRVSLVEPGFFRTDLLASGSANGADGAQKQGSGPYGDYEQKMAATAKAIQASEVANDWLSGGVPGVVDCVVDALCNRHPLARYVVGIDAHLLRHVVCFLPAWVVDWAQTLS